MLYDSHYNDNQQIVNIEYVKIKRRRSMKAANVAEAVKSENAVALLKQMYGENRAEENAARYQLVADGFTKEFGDKEFEFFSAP